MSNTTLKENLLVPEVISDMVASRFGDRMSLLPLVTVDDSLVGQPGDSLSFPAFRYIGKAQPVPENGLIEPGLLSAETVKVTVRKYAKAVQITDEARLSAFGDPVGEAASQLAHAIDHALDEDLYGLLAALPLSRKMPSEALSGASLAQALTLFGEELEGDKFLLTDPEGFAALRLDPDYIRASDLGQRMINKGVVGEIWGCQILVTKRVKPDQARGEMSCFVVKPGALRLVNKTDSVIEVQRDPSHMRDTVFASRHCALYLYDITKALALTRFTGIERLGADTQGIACQAGSAAGTTRLVISRDQQAPRGTRWAYLLSDSPQDLGAFGQTLSGLSFCQGDEVDIASGGKRFLHAVLVGDKDTKPIKTRVLSVQEA